MHPPLLVHGMLMRCIVLLFQAARPTQPVRLSPAQCCMMYHVPSALFHVCLLSLPVPGHCSNTTLAVRLHPETPRLPPCLRLLRRRRPLAPRPPLQTRFQS